MGIEIERDMRVFPVAPVKEKLSISDFLSRIASTYPLLGTAVISDNNFKIVEDAALQAIRLALEYRDLKDFAHLAILLTTIQYAKNWERDERSGFWAYICEQLGYKYSETLYAILTSSVKTACERYHRVFIKDLNGDNSYYSTVLAHAIAPSKSFYALCDFLVRFYKNNLDCSVYTDDPAIDRMVEVLRDRCKGATIEKDEDIRGNVIGIQAGFRALLTQRPVYMRVFLTKILQQMDILLSGDELGERDYTDLLLTKWYVGKITEPSVKRGTPVHKRTTDIAFSYGKIRISFILDDDGEPALRIPSIRLANRDNPVVTVFSGSTDVYRQIIGVYGNDYASTSEETIIPLCDLIDVDFDVMRVELSVGIKQIYSSALCTGALLFKDGKTVTTKTVDEGNYLLFAPKSATISFQGGIERQCRSYFAQLYDIYMQGEVSIYVNSALLCCSRPPVGSLRFRLPQSQSEYVSNGTSYPIYARDKFSITVVGQLHSENLLAITQSGEILSISGGDENVYLIGIPAENGYYTISLSDGDTGSILDEVRLYLVDSFAVDFDEPYYLENSEEGILSLNVNGEVTEVQLAGCGTKAKVPFNDGDILVQIPRIRLLLDYQPLPKNAIWREEISPSSRLWINCPDALNVSLYLGDVPLSKADTHGGFEYSIGNAIQAFDSADEKLPVELFILGNKHHMFDVVFKPCLTAAPLFNLSGSILAWMNPHAFVGDSKTKLKLSFRPKSGVPIIAHIEQGVRILSNNFPEKSERYEYKVFAVTETIFGTSENCVNEGSVIFGNRFEVIFCGETLRVTQIIEDGYYTEIKPFFIDDICYIGKENLGYTDLSGEYAHYKGKMYFITRNGKRYFTDLNPVDIYLVNEVAGRLHISFDDGAGLFIDKSGEFTPELYKYADPPPKLARFFTIPDYFEYKFSKEMY